MRDRKPFKLERTLLVYNFFQVALSVWMVYEGVVIWQYYSWRCQPVDWSRTPKGYREARVVYAYYLAKITELLDTIFFVLRKNDRQVTFLHVYHHTVMPMISWGTSKYYPGGHGTFIGWINSFVHIIMYSYYFLSAFGPQMQKYLWWKKYITNLQMVGLTQWGSSYIIIDNWLCSFSLSRSSSAAPSFIRLSCCTPTAAIQDGLSASPCPMPCSSISCSMTSIRSPTRRSRH